MQAINSPRWAAIGDLNGDGTPLWSGGRFGHIWLRVVWVLALLALTSSAGLATAGSLAPKRITATAGSDGTTGGSGAGHVSLGASQSANPVTPTVDADEAVKATLIGTNLFSASAMLFPSYGGGLPPAWGDYDNDGDPDLPLVRNDGGGAFSEMPGFRALLGDGNYHGAAWCDYDRDGDFDLALQPYGAGTHARLLKNQGDGTFVDVAPSLGMDVAGYGATAVWGDFDGDGWPDLFTPYYSYTAPGRSYLWHNNGNGTFTDVAVAAGVDLANLPPGLNPEGACAGDFDDDGDLDLYCAGHLFRNDGSGHFTDVRAAMGLPLVSDGAARWVDYDNDGDLDLSLRTAEGPKLFRNDGNKFTEVTAAAGLPQVGFMWGDSWADVDNDGDLDLYLSMPNLATARLYLNQGNGTFVQDPSFDIDDSSGLTAWADDDDDGDLDLHVEGNVRHRLENTLDQRPGFAGSWLKVVVLGSGGRRTSQGATVKLRRLDGTSGQVQARVVDGGSGYLSQNQYAVHFGVAPAGRYALSVSYSSPSGHRVVVDQTQVAWLGSLVPGSLASQTITVFKSGRANLGDWTITASAGSGGTISPSGEVPVSEGKNRTFTITPDPGYHIAEVRVDGALVGAMGSYAFTGVHTDHTINASFVAGVYSLAVRVIGSGSVTRDPDYTLGDSPLFVGGSTVTLTAMPAPGFAFLRWSGDAAGNANPLSLTMDANKTVMATFALANLLQEVASSFAPYCGGALSPAWGDYDNDGDVDLPLYRHDGNLTFGEIPGFRPMLADQNYHGSSWCDYDKDGNLDLAILPYSGVENSVENSAMNAGPKPHERVAMRPFTEAAMSRAVAMTELDHALLLHNNGDGTFTDVAPALGMATQGFGETAVWGDFDGDGWPDLFAPYYAHVPPYRSFLWHNNGDGTFTDIATAAGVDLADVPEALKPEGAHAVDIDGDGDLDLYCASHLFINDGTGHFTDVAVAAGLPQGFDEGAMFVDYDNDGDFDLYLRMNLGPRLFRNDGGRFTEVTAAAGLSEVPLGWGDTWVDVDNDGDLDLYLILPIFQSARLYLNQGDGTFVQDPTFNIYDSSGLNAWADVDHDGDMDLHVEAYYRHLIVNTLDQRPGFTGSWLRVVVLDAAGRQTQQGATLKLRRVDGNSGQVQTRAVDGGSGYVTQSEYPVHFGVDPAGTYALSVSFPSGHGTRVVVDATQVPWLGTIVPGTLQNQTITVFKNGRAHFGDWTITASAGSGGTITPSGIVPVAMGSDRTFTLAPALGYKVAALLVDGVSVGTPKSYSFSGIRADHTISASFVAASYTLGTDLGGSGTVARNPDLAQYPAGSTVQLTAVPGQGSMFVEWFGDADGSANPITLTMDADKVVTATFGDTARPAALVLSPNGGESIVIGTGTSLKWKATDNVGVSAVDLLLSRYGPGGPYDTLTAGIPNTGNYAWTVTAPSTPMALFKVRAHDATGHTGEDISNATFSILGTIGVEILQAPPPAVLTLGPVQPNPMREQTRIAFGLPVASRVRLQVLDLMGREVASLADGDLPAGTFTMGWDGRSSGRDLPAGMYFVRLQASGRHLVRRLVVMH